MCLRQGTCRKTLLMHDLTIPNASGFCVKNPFSSVGNGLLPEQPIKVHVSASIYLLALFFAFFVCEKCMAKRHPYHRSNRSDKEKAERLQIYPIKDQSFSHAIARIDGKHEHKAKSNRRQPLVLSPIIVFPIKRDRTIVAAGSIIHWVPPACASVILPAEKRHDAIILNAQITR